MRKLLVVLTLSLLTSSAFAAGYGAAGCGLGSMLFGDKDGMIQILAATTNGTVGNQTFGITSGTSNCASGGKTATMFIEANKASLSNDIARGGGETLSSLMEIYGCSEKEGNFEALQQNYSEIFSSQDAQTIDTSINNILNC